MEKKLISAGKRAGFSALGGYLYSSFLHPYVTTIVDRTGYGRNYIPQQTSPMEIGMISGLSSLTYSLIGIALGMAGQKQAEKLLEQLE